MRFRPTWRHAGVLALVSTSVCPAPVFAPGHGLRTEFGEVRLENLAIGKTYSVTRMAAAALVLHNTGGDSLWVQVDAVVPARHELRPGARPVPDTNWVRLEKSRFVLPANTAVRTDVYLTLPYDPDIAGNTYQVDILSRELRGSRSTVAPRHRLLFTVEMDPLDDTEATFSLRGDMGRPHAR